MGRQLVEEKVLPARMSAKASVRLLELLMVMLKAREYWIRRRRKAAAMARWWDYVMETPKAAAWAGHLRSKGSTSVEGMEDVTVRGTAQEWVFRRSSLVWS